MNSPQPKSQHRGADTPHRLIRAGLELFGTRDFDDVTTRQLADAAGVNLAAIPYHFGTKENVYLAVAEYIVDSIDPGTRATVHELDTLLSSTGADTAALLEGLRKFILAFSHEVLGVDDAALRASFILREHFRPSTAFDLLYNGFMCDLHTQLSRLYARLLGQDHGSHAILYRSQCLIGQILGFRIGQEVLLRRMNTRNFDPKAVAEFIAEQNLQAMRRELEEHTR